MYYNSKILWQPGMPLTASLMQHQENRLSNLQQLMVRTALGNGRFGLLPGCECHTTAGFVNRKYEMTGLRLTLMLPSGIVIDVDSDMELEIARINDEEVFVSIGIDGGKEYRFEQDGIPFTMPAYTLGLHTMEQMKQMDVVPLKRFTISNGMLNVDQDYIMPTLAVESDDRYMDFIAKYSESLDVLIKHEHMADDLGWSCKRNLLQLLFELKNISGQSATSDLTDLLQDIARTVDFFIIEQMGANIDDMPENAMNLHGDPRRELSLYNIASFLNWLDEYLKAMPEVMDMVQLIDHTIDIEALKAEIKNEVSEQLITELEQRMQQMHDQLTDELTTSIMNTLTEYINGTVKPEMRDELFAQLRDPLYNELYEALLNALSGVVNRQSVVDEDIFMPLI